MYGCNRHQGLVIVRHRYEAETFALVRREVSHDLDILDSAERTEQLPQDVLFRFRCQVVDEKTPTGSGEVVRREQSAGNREVALYRRKPANNNTFTKPVYK